MIWEEPQCLNFFFFFNFRLTGKIHWIVRVKTFSRLSFPQQWLTSDSDLCQVHCTEHSPLDVTYCWWQLFSANSKNWIVCSLIRLWSALFPAGSLSFSAVTLSAVRWLRWSLALSRLCAETMNLNYHRNIWTSCLNSPRCVWREQRRTVQDESYRSLFIRFCVKGAIASLKLKCTFILNSRTRTRQTGNRWLTCFIQCRMHHKIRTHRNKSTAGNNLQGTKTEQHPVAHPPSQRAVSSTLFLFSGHDYHIH